MTEQKITRTDAVSESLGFLLIFTMVIVGIGLVTLYGYPMLLQQQTSADEQIMEKNMIVLQNDVKSLAYKTVPYTETSMKIGGGSLTVYNASYDASTLEIKTTGGTPSVDYTFKLGDIRYESIGSGQVISLQDGAVISRNTIQSGSVMLAEPRWFYDGPTNTWVINLISMNSTGNLSRAGVGDAEMGLGETFYNVSVIPSGGQILLVYTPDLSQDNSVAWDNYFQNTLNIPPPVIFGSTRTYTLPANGLQRTLVIKKIDVIVNSV